MNPASRTRRLLSLLARQVRRLRLSRRVPAGTSRGRPGDGGRRRGDGGAGVREPRLPRPTPPAAGATAEPTREQFLDLPRG